MKTIPFRMCCLLVPAAFAAVEVSGADSPVSSRGAPSDPVLREEGASGAVGPTGDPAPVALEPARDKVWVGFRVGPSWRRGSKLSGSWSPERLRVHVPSAYSRSHSDDMPSASGYVDRDYLDGFVHLDEGTLEPETDIFGTTWNWGYDSASQYDGSTVSFHTGAGGSSDSFRAAAAAPVAFEEDVDTLKGWELGGDLSLLHVSCAEFGLSVSGRFFREEEAEFSGTAYMGREDHSSYTVVDVYDARWEGFPSAPYANDVDGPGYLLDAEPMARAVVPGPASSKKWTAASSAKATFDAWDFRVGPSAKWRPLSWLSIDGAVQFVMARASLDLVCDSVVTSGSRVVARDHDEASEDKWLRGASVSAGLGVVLPWGFTASASVARDWFHGDLDAVAGPASVKAELGEKTYSLLFGKEF